MVLSSSLRLFLWSIFPPCCFNTSLKTFCMFSSACACHKVVRYKFITVPFGIYENNRICNNRITLLSRRTIVFLMITTVRVFLFYSCLLMSLHGSKTFPLLYIFKLHKFSRLLLCGLVELSEHTNRCFYMNYCSSFF